MHLRPRGLHYYPTTIELKDRACVSVTIAYQSNGRIAGRIAPSPTRETTVLFADSSSDTVTRRLSE